MMMNTQTKESYILADSSKFGVAGFHSNIPLGSIKTIITDSLARPEDTGVFRAKNINVITV
jgi:DeoR/GlpR family transcriptional regulator of sugar metabolism